MTDPTRDPTHDPTETPGPLTQTGGDPSTADPLAAAIAAEPKELPSAELPSPLGRLKIEIAPGRRLTVFGSVEDLATLDGYLLGVTRR